MTVRWTVRAEAALPAGRGDSPHLLHFFVDALFWSDSLSPLCKKMESNGFDLALLRFPKKSAHPLVLDFFDRCAVTVSLHPPPAALRRLRPPAPFFIETYLFGGLAQLVERLLRKQEVTGSTPVISTKQVKGEPIPLGRWIRLYRLFLNLHMQSHRRFPACGFVLLGIP